jgi:predicted DNA-binding protein YlxM (UPF0122 family)
MDQNLLDSFAKLLRKQRKEYLDEFRTAEDALESIAEEREADWRSMPKKNSPHAC